MRFIRTLSRLLLGILFIFSGFVKALDPMGSAYKFTDYFNAFGMEFLSFLSLPLGILLAGFELVLGMVLLLGYQKRVTYWVLLVFMGFFTILTFVLALTNPVTDCGCFGDAIIITNWQTFFKNLVFMVFVLILFNARNRSKNVLKDSHETGIIFLLYTFAVFFSVYCLRHLPVIDFRPYDNGTNIYEEMSIPEGAPVDEYETILYYKNLDTGNEEAFTIENYPTDTVQYQFVTSESKLIKKGYEPPIHDFGVIDPNGNDVTDILLDYHGYSLLMLSYDLEGADENSLVSGNDWSKLQMLAEDLQFIPVTASATGVKNSIAENLDLTYDFYLADEIMLKTVVRSNPGFVLLKNGTILAKWSFRDFPDIGSWNKGWPEMLEQFVSGQDPEVLQLIEEGYMDDMTIDMIEFDRTANKIVSLKSTDYTDRLTWIVAILMVVLILVALQFMPKYKIRERV
ncbi:MAG: DoxX family membrane protein [Bacteroidales bacterium]|nr:DoxX family membrane protein [Bacteroidales bacterium]